MDKTKEIDEEQINYYLKHIRNLISRDDYYKPNIRFGIVHSLNAIIQLQKQRNG